MAARGEINKESVQPNLYEGWPKVEFDKCLDNVGEYVKLKTGDYGSNGLYPVIDQGEKYISGYVNNFELVYKGELPVVLFGDHTRIIKFVDQPFAVGADGVKILKPLKMLNPRFYFYYLKALNVPSLGYSRHYKILRGLDVPIPPLAEQKRIADKLDLIYQGLDFIKERQNIISRLIKQFTERVLEQAVIGELTGEWRMKNIANLERFQRDLSIFKNILPNENSQFHIPPEWKFIRLHNLVESVSYGTSAKSDNTGDVPVLRMGNLQNGKIDWNDLKYTSNKNEINKYKLQKGDVLFNRTNSPELVGKTSIYTGEQPAIYAGYLIKIKCGENLIPEYLNYLLNSPYGRNWSWSVKSDGVSQSNINAKKLTSFLVPLPTVNEQKEIVEKVNELFVIIDKIEAYYSNLYREMEALPEAILNKAFRGELVEQDEDDEPASELLGRIKIVSTSNEEKMLSQAETKVVTHELSHSLKSRITKSRINDLLMNLTEVIKKHFGNDLFTFEQLGEHMKPDSKEKYIKMKKEFFELLRNEKLKKKGVKIISEVDKSLGVLKYKLVSNETT